MANANRNRMSQPGSVVSTVPAVGADEDKRPTAAEIAKRTPKTYRAIARGYADGRIYDAGDLVVTRAERGSWMEPVGKKSADDRLANAVDDTSSPLNDDPALDTFSVEALQAEALRLGLTDATGLDKDDLIAAIRAAYVNEAQ